MSFAVWDTSKYDGHGFEVVNTLGYLPQDPDRNPALLASDTIAHFAQVGINTANVMEYTENYDGSIAIGSYYIPSVKKLTNPKLGASWTYNPQTVQYDPPYEKPSVPADKTNTHFYKWDEDAHQADNATGWTLIEKTN